MLAINGLEGIKIWVIDRPGMDVFDDMLQINEFLFDEAIGLTKDEARLDVRVQLTVVEPKDQSAIGIGDGVDVIDIGVRQSADADAAVDAAEG